MKSAYRTIWIIISAVAGIFLIYYFSDLVSFILASWVLSMLGRPIMKFFQNRFHFNKLSYGTSISALGTILIYVLLIALIGIAFIPVVVEQASHLANIDYTKIGTSLQQPISYMNEKLQSLGLITSEQSILDQIKDVITKWFRPERVSNIFGSIISVGSNLLFAIGSTIFITFFFLQEQGLFQEYLVALVPKKHEDKVKHIIDESSSLLRRYFGGLLIQMVLFSLVAFIGLSIFGVKNALLIAFFGGLMNTIPYVGPLIAMVFAGFLTLTSSVGAEFNTYIFPLVIKAVSSIFVAQVIDNWLVQPLLFSKTVKSHPLEIFIVILASAKMGGVTGMVLAIPAYTVLRVIARVFLSEYKIVQKITEDMEPALTEIKEESEVPISQDPLHPPV